MLTKGVLYYEFYLHPIWTSQSSLYGVWTFWQIQPRFASWPHKVATLLDPSILSGREGLYHPGFALAKRTRAIWRLFFHFEDKERHFMRLAQCKMSRSKHFETLDVEIIIIILLSIDCIYFMCSFWISTVFQDDHTVPLWLADLNRIPQQRCPFFDKRSVGWGIWAWNSAKAGQGQTWFAGESMIFPATNHNQ